MQRSSSKADGQSAVRFFPAMAPADEAGAGGGCGPERLGRAKARNSCCRRLRRERVWGVIGEGWVSGFRCVPSLLGDQ